MLIRSNKQIKGMIITDHDYQNVIKISTSLVLIKEGKRHHINKKEDLIEKGYLSNTSFI